MHKFDEILTAFANDDLTDSMRYDACVMVGIPKDAAEFIVECRPELADNYAISAIAGCARYNSFTFEVMSEEGLYEWLNCQISHEMDYTESVVFIIRDDAFDGVLVAASGR